MKKQLITEEHKIRHGHMGKHEGQSRERGSRKQLGATVFIVVSAGRNGQGRLGKVRIGLFK